MRKLKRKLPKEHIKNESKCMRRKELLKFKIQEL